jgi:glycosyltransferase involved in cell wall biosynthesis
MKILILASNLSNEAGGYSESTLLQRESLDKKRNQAFLLGYWESNSLIFMHNATYKINLFKSFFFKIFPFSNLYFKKMISIKPDIIDVQGLWNSASIFNFLYFRNNSTPYLITPRGMLEKWALQKSYFKKKIFYHLLEKNNINNAACIRVTSLLEAKNIRSIGFKNSIVNIPNAIPISKINLKIKKNSVKKRILFLSRLNPKKGLFELLNAWKIIQDKNLDWELVICGYDENGYKKKMLYLSVKLKLKRVVFLEHVYGEKKNALYKSCDLFILLSHSENFGLVIAEALSFGLPVITTVNTPWKSLNKKGCGWCIELNEKIIINTMNYAMNLSNKERFEMGKKARKWIAKDYSINAMATKLCRVYNWILNKGPKPKDLLVK